MNEGAPILKKELKSTNNPTTSSFGFSVSLNGDKLLVGALQQIHEDAWNNNKGSAYLYQISNYNVSLIHDFYFPITQNNGPSGFGIDVILNQDYLAIASATMWEPENLYIYSGFGENYLLSMGSPEVVPPDFCQISTTKY